MYTCGAIASTADVGLSIPPVAPADVPALFHPRVGDIYLRWGRDFLPAVLGVVYLRSSVLAGRCLPAVLTSTCGAFGMFTSGGAEIFMPDGMGCIPPVVSPTLGGSSLSLPPVAPADVPAITAQDLGHLPAVLLDYSRIVLNFRSGVMCRAIAPLRFLDEK